MEDIKGQDNIDYGRLVEGAGNRDDLYKIIFQHAADAVIVVDQAGTVLFLNPSAEHLFSVPASQLIGQPFRFKNMDEQPHEVEVVRSEDDPRTAELRWIRAQLRDETLYVAYLRDVTEPTRLREELQAVTFVDKLTGLFNRPGFFTLAQQQLQIASRGRSGLFLFLATVNDLIRIENNYGESECDRMLVETANVLKSTFRRSDIITRVDRDQFAMMILDVYGQVADVIASRLLVNLDDFNNKGVLPYRITLSMGIVPFNPERPNSIGELMVEAERAMSENKQGRQNLSLKWSLA